MPELNVWNPQEIDVYLGTAWGDGCNGVKGVGRLMVLALRRPILNHAAYFTPLDTLPDNAPAWLISKFGKGETFYTFHYKNAHDIFDVCEKINHIYHWIEGAIQRGEEWTKEEKPRHLCHFKTIDEAYAAADAAMQSLRSQLANKADPTSGTKVVMTFKDGWSIRRLLTPEAKDYDGYHLHHCVGDGAYDDRKIYSLRDPQNKPIMTMNINNIGQLVECKGLQNSPADEKALPYLRKFVKFACSRYNGVSCGCDLIQRDGICYTVYNLPEKFQAAALNLSMTNQPVTLPSGLIITNTLTIRATHIPRHPTLEDIEHEVTWPDNVRIRYIRFEKKYKGKLHNEDGPAKILFEVATGEILKEEWYKNGKLFLNKDSAVQIIRDLDRALRPGPQLQ